MEENPREDISDVIALSICKTAPNSCTHSIFVVNEVERNSFSKIRRVECNKFCKQEGRPRLDDTGNEEASAASVTAPACSLTPEGLKKVY